MAGIVLPGEGQVFRKDKWFESTGYAPHRGQQIIHYDSTRHRILCNGRRWGKLLALNTLIVTPTGFTTMGEVAIGDQVVGSDGLACEVLDVFSPKLEDGYYELELDDGTTFRTHADHQWVTYDRAARRAQTSSSRHTAPQIRTTEEILKTLTYSSHGQLRANHTIRVCEPLKLPEASLPIEPYLLGAWLGDGHTNSGRIAVGFTDREEMTTQLEARGHSINWVKGLTCFGARVEGFQSSLRKHGLLNNKHIPPAYLRASIDQRRELLAGLLDTDGSSDKSRVSYTTVLPALADQIFELVSSLGYKATLTSRIGKLDGVEKKRAYRIRFHTNDRVFSYARKQRNEHYPLRGLSNKHRAIVAIRPIAPEPMKCIMVDSSDHTYLVGKGMVVTHNTMLGGKESECLAFVRNWRNEPMRGWIIGPEYTDCEKEFRIVHDTFKSLGIDKVSSKFLNNTENGNMHIKTKWGFDLECRSARHPESLVGEGLDFVLLVEAGRHKRRMFGDYVRPALSDKRGMSLMSGVPEEASESSLLYWAYNRGQDITKTQWKSWRMPSWTNSIVFPGGRNDPEILEAEDDLTEDEFKRQYGGEFVQRFGRVMTEWDDDTHTGHFKYNPDWPLFAAVDFGYTNDWVWLWVQHDVMNNIVYVIGEHRFKMRDTEDIMKNEMMHHIWTQKLVAIYVDPAAPDDASIIRRHSGVPTRANTGGEIKLRLAMIRASLKTRPEHLPPDHPERRAGLYVDKSCHNLIWEMREGYRWPERSAETRNDSELPMDKNNHGPEALGRFFKGHMEKYQPKRAARQGQVKQRRAS